MFISFDILFGNCWRTLFRNQKYNSNYIHSSSKRTTLLGQLSLSVRAPGDCMTKDRMRRTLDAAQSQVRRTRVQHCGYSHLSCTILVHGTDEMRAGTYSILTWSML